MKISGSLLLIAGLLLAACSSPLSSSVGNVDSSQGKLIIIGDGGGGGGGGGGNPTPTPVATPTPIPTDLAIWGVGVSDYGPTFVSYVYSVANTGTVAVDKSSIVIQAVISPDTIFFNAGDTPAGGTTVGNPGDLLLPGQTITRTFQCTLAPGTIHPESAVQYLVIKVDYPNIIAESNEGNNVWSNRIPILH